MISMIRNKYLTLIGAGLLFTAVSCTDGYEPEPVELVSIDFVFSKTDSLGTNAVKFMNNIYYGVSASTTYDSNFIESLTKELRQATEMNFRVNAGKDEYICFAYPSHYGEAVFSVGGFEGGFREVAKFYYTNESGYNEQYTVYCSDNPCLGDTRVKVIYV